MLVSGVVPQGSAGLVAGPPLLFASTTLAAVSQDPVADGAYGFAAVVSHTAATLARTVVEDPVPKVAFDGWSQADVSTLSDTAVQEAVRCAAQLADMLFREATVPAQAGPICTFASEAAVAMVDPAM